MALQACGVGPLGNPDVRQEGQVEPQLVRPRAGVEPAVQPHHVTEVLVGNQEGVGVVLEVQVPEKDASKYDLEVGRRTGVPLDVVDERRLRNVVGRKDKGEMGIDDIDVELIVLAAYGLNPREVVVGEGRVGSLQGTTTSSRTICACTCPSAARSSMPTKAGNTSYSTERSPTAPTPTRTAMPAAA